jgi:hypothetical protein
MFGKERQPSSKTLASLEEETTRGLTSTRSASLRALSPVSLNTMRRAFTPTWGAARPTPSSLQESDKIRRRRRRRRRRRKTVRRSV